MTRVDFISFPLLEEDDLRFCLDLRNEERIRKVSLQQDPISFEDHVKYVQTLRAATDRYYFLIRYEGEAAGVLSLKAVDKEQGQWEYGMYYSLRKPGASKSSRRCAPKVYAILGVKELLNHVHKDNVLGMHLAKAEGFEFGEEDAEYPGFLKTKRRVEPREYEEFCKYASEHELVCRVIV